MANYDEYDEVYILCVHWDIAELDPVRREFWERAEAMLPLGTPKPPRYPGSVRMICSMCTVGVSVGPKQQEAIASLPPDRFRIVCIMCHGWMVQQSGGSLAAEMKHLGNPWLPTKGKDRH